MLRSGHCYHKFICLSSVTLVYPTQAVEPFDNIFEPCPSSDLRAKFYRDHPRGTPPPGALNARGVSKYSDGGPIEGYIS